MSLSPKRLGRRPLGDIHNIIGSPTSKSDNNIPHANNDGCEFDIFTDSLVSPKKRRLVTSVQRNEFIRGESTTPESAKNSREEESAATVNTGIPFESFSPQRHSRSTPSVTPADGSQPVLR